MNLDEFFAPFNPPLTNMADRLRYWAEHQPDHVAFYFLADGEEQEEHVTYAELDRQARAIAAKLISLGMSGERALLLYPPGLDFVAGFFGCLYAGATAVPAYPPRRNRNMARIQAISDDAEAKVALTVIEVTERVQGLLEEAPHLKDLIWLGTDQLPLELADEYQPTPLPGDSLAVLQYTSGSTGTPKGVMLSHDNLMDNCSIIAHGFEPDRDGSGASWLPTYHDMGLIGGVLQPMYIGKSMVMMSPMSFLQKPVRWLWAISRYGSTISGGPNFAYALCVEKVTPEECQGLDLRSWKVAFNGAEPIRAETLRAFSKKFEPYGFRPQTHYACYGMAETTLIVTGSVKKDPPVIRLFNGSAIDEHRVETAVEGTPGTRDLVGCGRILPGEQVIIVDAETKTELPPDQIGEIWVSGGSVGKGYWKKPEATRETFECYLANGAGPYLRTGDLGFLDQGELFVTGRLKDLIIVRGVNRYPQDVESTVEKASDRLAPGGAAAFAADIEGRERLIVVCEIERSRNKEWTEVIDAVRRAVTSEHELPPDAVILVRAGSIPKTSSGKIQRRACRDDFMAGELASVAEWYSWKDSGESLGASGSQIVSAEGSMAPPGVNGKPLVEVNTRIVQVVLDTVREVARERAKALHLDTNIVSDLGLDSLERMQVAAKLEQVFGGRFPDEVLQQIETIREVSAAIEKHIGDQPQLRTISSDVEAAPARKLSTDEIPEEYYHFGKMPEYQRLQQTIQGIATAGVPNPYFKVHEGIISDTTRIGGREYINFSSFNYLGMSGDEALAEASKAAIDKFGTSVSASRLVSGEKTIHRELEAAISELLGVDDAITFSAGHSTNESTIGHLFGPGDLILHDSLAHNSIIKGAELSGARRRPFPHNDYNALDEVLTEVRGEYRRVLVAIEGVYSMDGDYADLPKFVEIKRRHKAFILVDEAHSLGTMGARGHGLREFFDIAPSDVDLWMGTLSKALGSCGGYIAGGREVIEYLKYTAPAFVFATGIAPSNVAAALEAIRVLDREPQRVARVQARGKLFLDLARERGLNTGLSGGTPIIPIILGNSLHALQISARMSARGINVQPILHPAVEEERARLRFFITASHTEEQIRLTVKVLAEELAQIDPRYVRSARPSLERKLAAVG